MQVVALRIYPVKSLAGVALPSALVEPWGLDGDRRWGLVDEHGEKITARELHPLLGLRAEPIDSRAIRLVGPDGASLVVAAPRGAEPVAVSHARQDSALPAPPAVNRWLSERLGQPVRLVWQEDPTARAVAADKGGLPGESLSLADAGPLLLASEASMAQLNTWIAADSALPDLPDLDPNDLSADARSTQPLDVLRFRPNVVIDGDVPFAEDSWPTVRVGSVDFRTSMVCDRCVMTTIDPLTLAGGKEPIRTLARHRRWDGKTWFGTRLVPLTTGTIAVGDPVQPGRPSA